MSQNKFDGSMKVMQLIFDIPAKNSCNLYYVGSFFIKIHGQRQDDGIYTSNLLFISGIQVVCIGILHVAIEIALEQCVQFDNFYQQISGQKVDGTREI